MLSAGDVIGGDKGKGDRWADGATGPRIVPGEYACGIVSDGIQAEDRLLVAQNAPKAVSFEAHEGSQISRHHLHRIEWGFAYGPNTRVRSVISVPIKSLIGIPALPELWVRALFGEVVEIGDGSAQPRSVNARNLRQLLEGFSPHQISGAQESAKWRWRGWCGAQTILAKSRVVGENKNLDFLILLARFDHLWYEIVI
jgi:hypothetical protein